MHIDESFYDLKNILKEKFRFKLPRNFSKNHSIDKKRILLRQFQPSVLELASINYSNQQDIKNYIEDPLSEEDEDINPLPYIIHKYPNKILVLTNDSCPVYCRYCTRKRKTLKNPNKDKLNIKKLVEYLKDHSTINEVILSGGDPGMLPHKLLSELFNSILKLSQISYLRVHTRTITTEPESFLNNLMPNLLIFQDRYPKKVISVVMHINHKLEFDIKSIKIIKNLTEKRIPVYSQSVLLNGINNEQSVLIELFQLLIRLNIKPYYIHQLDQVEGSRHFYVPVKEGIKLMKEVRKVIPIYFLPRYVQDSKTGKVNLYY